tara:strand:- start:186 stop:1331 length:1146 start_codon:yes stop_codon:yes gene_type:complete
MEHIFSDFKQNKDTLTFTISNCDVSFANALRRTILTDVVTVGFNTDDYNTSDLKVIKNNSCLHNEFLLHRLGLVPIYSSNIDKFDCSLYKYILKVKNVGNDILDVTTRDIQVINVQTNTEEENNNFFKANEITGDHILLTKLKPNPDQNGEEIHIEGTCSKGSGSDNIRYSPVSKMCFVNKIDPARAQEALQVYLAENAGKDTEEKLIRRFNIEESERHYYVNENGDPNVFDFIIESKGVMKPYKILIEAIKCLIKKLQNFNNNIDLFLKREKSTIEITESSALMKGFELTINEESHTLGFLIQSYINLLHSDVIFIGYMNPHPLQKKIMFRISSSDDDVTVMHNIFKETSNHLIGILDKLKKEFMRKFEGKVMFKPKKKK